MGYKDLDYWNGWHKKLQDAERSAARGHKKLQDAERSAARGKG
jgi:hypothetical protein